MKLIIVFITALSLSSGVQGCVSKRREVKISRRLRGSLEKFDFEDFDFEVSDWFDSELREVGSDSERPNHSLLNHV